MPEMSREPWIMDHGDSNDFDISEIEEVKDLDDLFDIDQYQGIPYTIKEEEFEGSIASDDKAEGDIYVAVGKSVTSMDALMWTLKHLVKKPSSSSTTTKSFLYLIHIFPEVRHIPTPLGKFPKEQLRPEQVENYMEQQRNKRRELLQKFLNICSTSKVNVDTVLIESDNVAKAILDLIDILNIKNLVVGTTKSSARKLRRGGGIGNEIVKNAPEFCQVRIICQGNEVNHQIPSGPSTPKSTPATPQVNNIADAPHLEEDQNGNTSSSCSCFARKFI